MVIFENILDTIGGTPLVRLNKMAPAGVNVYVKVESFNPMGSIKDRMALAVIEDAERSGQLRPGQTVIEATSGNTGIGLAMVCAQKGYPMIVVMAENFSIERRRLMRFLGAEVVLTPAAEKGTGMLAKARELANTHGYFLCRQFDNEANADVHSRTTAQEILDDLGSAPLDYWVTGFGTGGTLKGVSRRLKSDSPTTRVIVAEPDNSQVLGSGIRQPRDGSGSPNASHPNFRPHAMQGWSPDFISSLTESAVNSQWVDDIVPVSGDDAIRLARELATREGILAGISSGATLAAALEVAARARPGSNIVCMLPDTGERYMSTPLFDGIPVDMTAREIEISQSTPLAQFTSVAASTSNTKPARQGHATPAIATDTPTDPPAEIPPEVMRQTREEPLDSEAVRFLTDTVAHNPVVMFALEWCEFCWSVRKMFRAMGVDFVSVDLDSVAFQDGDRGGKIRKVLATNLGVQTIPQIFLDGESIGGATELFEAWKSGELQPRLRAMGVDFDDSAITDVGIFMPQWLQPRKSA